MALLLQLNESYISGFRADRNFTDNSVSLCSYYVIEIVFLLWRFINMLQLIKKPLLVFMEVIHP
jgi:hypothetical protein